MQDNTNMPPKDRDDIGSKLDAAVKRIEELEAKLKALPAPRDMGFNIPIHAFETDKNFRHQLDRGHLTLQLNTDELTRNMSATGGGGGVGPVGFQRVGRLTGPTGTGIVDARGNAVQWLYSIVEVKPGATAAYDEWVNHVDGFSGPARNLKEDGNTGIGVQGNGVDFDAQIFTDNPDLKMQPIRDLVFFDLKQAQNGEICAWFSEPNAVSGECGSSSS